MRDNTDDALHALGGDDADDAADNDDAAGISLLAMTEGERTTRRLRCGVRCVCVLCGVRYGTDTGGAEARSSSSNKFSSPPSVLSTTSVTKHMAGSGAGAGAGAAATAAA